MGICKKIKRTDLKWHQILWNIIVGHKERNYTFVESNKQSKGVINKWH